MKKARARAQGPHTPRSHLNTIGSSSGSSYTRTHIYTYAGLTSTRKSVSKNQTEQKEQRKRNARDARGSYERRHAPAPACAGGGHPGEGVVVQDGHGHHRGDAHAHDCR